MADKPSAEDNASAVPAAAAAPVAAAMPEAAAGGAPQLEGVAHPGLNDVMFGRGGDTNYHIGNHRFRVLADEHRHEYRSASRKEKALVVQEVVRIWRGRGGRFLTKTEPEKGDASLWHDVGNAVAHKKAAKILSEKAPQDRGKKSDGRGGKGRKRPAVDSLDADKAGKQAALTSSVVAGNQPGILQAAAEKQSSLTALAPTAATAVASLLPAAAAAAAASLPHQQRLPAPLQPPAAAPAPAALQLPSLATLAQAQASLQQSLQAPMATAAASNLLRDLRAQANPLVLGALSLDPADTMSSQLVLTALALVQQNEQDAARSRALLAHALIVENLRRLENERAAASRLALASTPSTPVLNSDQLRLLLLATLAQQQESNTTNSNRDDAKPNGQ